MLEVDDISSTTANDNTVTSVTGEDVLVAEQSCSNSSKEKEAGSSLSLSLSSSPIIQSIYEKNHDNSTHIIYTDEQEYDEEEEYEQQQQQQQQQRQHQEWTYEDHNRSMKHHRNNDDVDDDDNNDTMASYTHRSSKQEKQTQQQLLYEEAERRRMKKVTMMSIGVLMFEIAAATVAFLNYQDLIECCGTSIFTSTETWNTVFYWISIAYLIVIIVIEIPTLVVTHEPLFVFNPMVGFVLAMHMIYVTDTHSAYIIFGLETAAMFGQSMVLVQMQNRGLELFIHSVLNYTLCGLVLYMLIQLQEQGGYCIIDERIQSVFTVSSCNIGCIEEESCYQCEANITSCFIQFPADKEI